eukprot:7387617-Prymnesium_polylepis.2
MTDDRLAASPGEARRSGGRRTRLRRRARCAARVHGACAAEETDVCTLTRALTQARTPALFSSCHRPLSLCHARARARLCRQVYLRYYQPRRDGQAGDTSPGFAFALLFPAPLQRPLAVIGASCYGVVSSCGCFPPADWVRHTAAVLCRAVPPSRTAVPHRRPAPPSRTATLHTMTLVVPSHVLASRRRIRWCQPSRRHVSIASAAARPVFRPWQESHSGTAPVLPPELPELPSELIPAPPPPAVTTSDPLVAERRRDRARLLIEARLAEKTAAAPAADAAPAPAAGA